VDLRRVRTSDWAAGLFGAALIGLLWAPWYRAFERPSGTFFFDRSRLPASDWSGWQSMAVNDVIFLVAGLLGIWVVVATATQSTGAVPIAADAFASLVGVVASVLAVIRLIWPPDLGLGPTNRAAGVWLGTGAALAMTFSALASISSERRGEGVEVPVTPLPAPRGTEP
jgi:hypothetical protein